MSRLVLVLKTNISWRFVCGKSFFLYVVMKKDLDPSLCKNPFSQALMHKASFLAGCPLYSYLVSISVDNSRDYQTGCFLNPLSTSMCKLRHDKLIHCTYCLSSESISMLKIANDIALINNILYFIFRMIYKIISTCKLYLFCAKSNPEV